LTAEVARVQKQLVATKGHNVDQLKKDTAAKQAELASVDTSGQAVTKEIQAETAILKDLQGQADKLDAARVKMVESSKIDGISAAVAVLSVHVCREEHLAHKFNTLADEVEEETSHMSSSDIQTLNRLQKEIKDITSQNAALAASADEFKKWRAGVLLQNAQLREDIARNEHTATRSHKLELALGTTVGGHQATKKLLDHHVLKKDKHPKMSHPTNTPSGFVKYN